MEFALEKIDSRRLKTALAVRGVLAKTMHDALPWGHLSSSFRVASASRSPTSPDDSTTFSGLWASNRFLTVGWDFVVVVQIESVMGAGIASRREGDDLWTRTSWAEYLLRPRRTI